ncbi:unnamed protein product [Parascedosporium putredinis]|uniref:Uncharacterized protein n=1 Tax=Parascedosporium putredinis TaxID=1442378 RepID=A0A9P1HAG9_9PEZI|nr:unnamed protein product [Parascedosporium putredinis]CAI8004595.1 unnamed protein product [Parascedosporium putredinis]
MNSFFTVNNHVSISLLSVTVTPSTFLAALIFCLVFISIYISLYLAPISAATSAVTAPFRRVLAVVRPKASAAPAAAIADRATALVDDPATIPLRLHPSDQQLLIASHRPLPALPSDAYSEDLEVSNPDTALVLRTPRRSRNKVAESVASHDLPRSADAG